MAITMQSSWTLRVKTRNAAFAQRFIVSGASTGNGIHDGVVGNAVFVTGAQWSVSIQHQPTGQPWREPAQRIGLPGVTGGLLRLDITSNDGVLDEDHDDLVLVCSAPASQSDYVVYGTVKTYSGACLFNPCRDDYLVIDPPFHLNSICARYPQLCEVIKKLYPQRLRVPRVPLPDSAPDLTPIVIPTGLPNGAVGLVFQSRLVRAPKAESIHVVGKGKKPSAAQLDEAEADAVGALQTTVKRVAFKSSPLKAGMGRLARSELETIANIRDAAIRFHCHVERAPGLLLRFQEYDRAAAELLGGAYTGTGAREDLGLAVTDELGNYIFRFSQTLDDIADETSDVAPGKVLAPALRPDVILQVLGTGLTVSFETAPYDNIANLRRIDLCVPYSQAYPNRAGAGDRVIQRIGDVALLHPAIGGAPNRGVAVIAAEHELCAFAFMRPPTS